MIKDIYKKSKASTIFNGQRLNVSLKIKNKTKMSTLSTSLQYCTGSSNQCDTARKTKLKTAHWKGRRKTVYSEITIIYTEQSKESTKKLLE